MILMLILPSLVIGTSWLVPVTAAQERRRPILLDEERRAPARPTRPERLVEEVDLPAAPSDQKPEISPPAPTSIEEKPTKPADQPGVYHPTNASAKNFPPINVSVAVAQAAFAPKQPLPAELKSIDPPKGRPDWFENRGRKPGQETKQPVVLDEPTAELPAPSAQGSSPAPHKTFHGEVLTGSTIPPDTMGAVGTNHIVTVSNNELSFRTREGALISRLSLNAFWSGVMLEGGATPSTFDPKIFYDRFADRFFFFTSANAVSLASSVLFAVTQTGDPTGTWDRYVFDADPTATAASGRWADYPTVGFNKNWIVANYNVFNYTGTSTTGYYGPYIYVIPKNDAYDGGTLTTTSLFQESVASCVSPFNQILGCGFTMAPAVVEDNTTEANYLVEDWDSVFGQLRVSKITGTQAAPVLTIGTQFPQSTENWRFNAARIGTGGTAGASGGYVPQRQQSAHLVSGQRVMANDSRINNAVLRNGSLWCSHHAMVGLAPNPPGTAYGTANPDVKTAVQWWEINPTVEAQPDVMTGLGTPPIQRGRIVDPLADNCNSGNTVSASTERTAGSTIPCNAQQGQFFFFAGIAVNQNNDVLIGFTQSSPLTYPSGAYALRRSTDPANTMRDVVVFRSGASNYNIGSGTGSNRQNRWGDYSAAMVDPVNDTDFWVNQEYSETRTALAGLAGAIAAPWATWWALVKPGSTQPTTTGNLIISEFRARGPQGISDEFVELYNPNATTPFRVASVDGSEGWALATNNGTTTTALATIPQGVVIPPRGHYLFANSPVSTAAGAENLYYSLGSYPGSSTLPGTTVAGIRSATADTGYSTTGAATDAIADTNGIAIFKSTNSATGFIAANVADAAGPNTLPGGSIFREGAGYAPLPTTNLQYAMFRNLTNGTPQDTGDNAADFTFVDVAGTPTTAGQRLGAPGPENVDSPIQRNSQFAFVLVDSNFAASASPNRLRDSTADPGNNSTFGTLTIRRRIVNNTGAPVTRLRFRIVDMTSSPQPALIADLRARTSMNVVLMGITDAATCAPAMTPCSVTVQGTALETPPAQTAGGGLNGTYSVDLPAPLAAGASINVGILLGVQQTGYFRFFVNVEALP